MFFVIFHKSLTIKDLRRSWPRNLLNINELRSFWVGLPISLHLVVGEH